MAQARASRPEQTTGEEKPKNTSGQEETLGKILEIVTAQQDKMDSFGKRLDKLEGKTIQRPESFQVAQDDKVQPEVSRAVRSILGNHVGLKAEEVKNQAGFLLHVIIPERFHTEQQRGRYHQQREEYKRDENGKIVETKIVDFVVEDRRSKMIPIYGSEEAARKWAGQIADKIRDDFAKAKLSEPDFFAD